MNKRLTLPRRLSCRSWPFIPTAPVVARRGLGTWTQGGGTGEDVVRTGISGWLVRGRAPQPQPVAEIPGDISPRPLTRPLVLYAVIRAVAASIAVAISFGLKLPDAY
jgi:hypothetical protein